MSYCMDEKQFKDLPFLSWVQADFSKNTLTLVMRVPGGHFYLFDTGLKGSMEHIISTHFVPDPVSQTDNTNTLK